MFTDIFSASGVAQKYNCALKRLDFQQAVSYTHLSGAVMGLFKPDTEEFTEENALLPVTTGEDGSFAFENIPYGHRCV